MRRAGRLRAASTAAGVHKKYPGRPRAHNGSPSFSWKGKLDVQTIPAFQDERGEIGYKFLFITLAGFHAYNHSMFELARSYKKRQLTAYVTLQQAEFDAESNCHTATRHQREVGAGYLEEVTQAIMHGLSTTTTLHGCTEEQKFMTA